MSTLNALCRLAFAASLFSLVIGDRTLGAEPNDELPFFSQAKVEDLSPDDPSTLVVSRVHPRSASEQAGVLAGDVVLGIGGLRVYGLGEMMYVDQYLRQRREPFEIIVSRRGKILALELDELPMDGSIGFLVVAEDWHWAKLAERLGEKLTPERTYVLATTNPRLALVGQRWLDEEPARLEDAAWLRDFVRLRLTLAEQRWNDAAPIEHEIPLPEFRRVADFWIEVARRNASGETLPDPEALGVDLDFFCFNYPLPRYVSPPLKDFAASDEKWKRMLEEHVANPLLQPWGEGSFATFDKPGNDPYSFDGYLSMVKLSAVSPILYGHWPCLRPRLDKDWRDFNKRLEKLREDDPGDWALYTYALAMLSLMRQDVNLTIKLTEELEKRSPFLAHRAAGNLRFAMQQGWLRAEERKRFEDRFAKLRLPHGPKEDLVIQHIVARMPATHRRFDPFMVPASEEQSFYFAGNLRDSLARDEPYDVTYAKLRKDAESGAAAKNPADALRRMETLLTPRMSVDDLTLISAVADGAHSEGLFLETMTRLLERSVIVGEPREIIPRSLVQLQNERLSSRVGNDDPYARVYRGLREIDWRDREKALQRVQTLFEQDGVLAAVAEISVQLRTHGLDDEADAYDEKLDRWLDGVMGWYRIEFPKGNPYAYADLASALSSHPVHARKAERLLRQLVAEDDLRDSWFIVTELHRARCLMTLGRLDEAAEALGGAYDLSVHRFRWAKFSVDGRTISDVTEYRRHLFSKLTDDPRLSEERKSALRTKAAADIETTP